MRKHTKGPWRVAHFEGILLAVDQSDEHGAPNIARISLSNGLGLEQNLSNARLLATAPTLLKGLKLAVMEFERISYQKKCDPEVLEYLKRTIALAEGEQKSLKEGCEE